MNLPSFRAFIDYEMIYFEKSGNISNIIAFCEDRWVFLAHNQMNDEIPTWESMYITSKQDDPDVSLMICAEFKDSKDTYIWEGDILATLEEDDHEYGVVHFSLTSGIQIIGIETNTPWDFMNPSSWYNLKKLKVIGNIHQTKDLLKRRIYGKE